MHGDSSAWRAFHGNLEPKSQICTAPTGPEPRIYTDRGLDAGALDRVIISLANPNLGVEDCPTLILSFGQQFGIFLLRQELGVLPEFNVFPFGVERVVARAIA